MDLLRRVFGVLRLLLEKLFFLGSHLRRDELDRQLVELAGEAERRLVVIVVYPRASIHPDVEGLIDGHEERNGMWDALAGYFLAVHRQRAGAALAEAGTVVFEVEQDGMLAGRKGV